MLRIGLVIAKLLILLLAIALLGYGSCYYANSIDLFSLQKVVVSGTSLVPNHEVLKSSGVTFGSSLFHLPLDSIQQRIVAHPYIQAVQISRQFPRTVFIQVRERDPIAYINHGDFSCVDQYGVIIPVPRTERTLSLPVLSGFDGVDNLQAGSRSSDPKLIQAVDLLDQVRRDHPDFYARISELVATNGEYVIYTAENTTKIFLGQTALPEKVRLLNAFRAATGDQRSWGDYEYIDLRYAKQVIVRERT